MTSPETVIELTFNRQHFEDIYFKNKQGYIFLSPECKERFIILLAFSIVLIASIIYYLFTDTYLGLAILLFFCFTLAAADYRLRAVRILRWKKDVNKLLNKLSLGKKQQVILTDKSITVIEDNEETILTWASFTKALINDSYIELFSKSDFFLYPKKSMTESDYELLKDMIHSKIKNE